MADWRSIVLAGGGTIGIKIAGGRPEFGAGGSGGILLKSNADPQGLSNSFNWDLGPKAVARVAPEFSWAGRAQTRATFQNNPIAWDDEDILLRRPFIFCEEFYGGIKPCFSETYRSKICH